MAALRPDAILNVLTLASELLAIQLTGAATSPEQLSLLCLLFGTFTSTRLQDTGYDVPLSKNIIYSAAHADALPRLPQI